MAITTEVSPVNRFGFRYNMGHNPMILNFKREDISFSFAYGVGGSTWFYISGGQPPVEVGDIVYHKEAK